MNSMHNCGYLALAPRVRHCAALVFIAAIASAACAGPPADYYFHADDLDSVFAVSGASGARVESYEYDDFGAATVRDAADLPLPASAIANELLFTGRRLDSEALLYYFRTRFLEPLSGSFTSRDMIGMWGDPVNLGDANAYVGNNPASRNDPFGERWWCTQGLDDLREQEGAFLCVLGCMIGLDNMDIKILRNVIRGAGGLTGKILWDELRRHGAKRAIDLITKAFEHAAKQSGNKAKREVINRLARRVVPMFAKYAFKVASGVGVALLVGEACYCASCCL